jgi:hypothetical protein
MIKRTAKIWIDEELKDQICIGQQMPMKSENNNRFV